MLTPSKKQSQMFDDPALSLRMKFGTLSPPLLSATVAGTAVPPPQQPAFARNDSSGFMIPAYYKYPSRTEIFSPLGTASNRLQGVTWNANPLAADADVGADARGASPLPPPLSSIEPSPMNVDTVDRSTRGWRSVAAALNSSSSYSNSNSENKKTNPVQ